MKLTKTVQTKVDGINRGNSVLMTEKQMEKVIEYFEGYKKIKLFTRYSKAYKKYSVCLLSTTSYSRG